MMESGYERIKALAKARHCNIPDLLVLARQNDPFFAGSNTSREMAEWFADLWRQFGYSTGVHLRRVHYQLVSQEEAKKHNGLPYENTENDWNYLCNAGKYARYLGLIDPTAFVDRRNPDPHVFRRYGTTQEDVSWSYEFPGWYLPEIDFDLAYGLDWELPEFRVHGFEYSEELQPYHLEVWVEKSTMDDVLLPFCERYAVNMVTGLGFMSITSVIDLVRRVSQIGKPCRILYISDFDPAGAAMPVAVARQIEYWLAVYDLDADIKLEPIVLTAEQVEAYQLPRIPVKESDRRKASFERRNGEGAVELDALEALYPGELARIVKESISQFRDEELAKKVYEAKEEADEELAYWWESEIEPYQEDIDELKTQAMAVIQEYQEKLKKLSTEMKNDLRPFEEKLNSLWQAITNRLETIYPELPELPEAETYSEEDDWLFDSGRDYLSQLAVYTERKGG